MYMQEIYDVSTLEECYYKYVHTDIDNIYVTAQADFISGQNYKIFMLH